MSQEGTQAFQRGAQRWVETLQHLAEQIQRQQRISQQITEELMNTYMQLLNTQWSYVAQLPQQQQQQQQQQNFQQLAQQWMQQFQQFQQQAQQQQQDFQQMVQQAMGAYAQMFDIPASQAREGAQIAQESAQIVQRATSEVPIEGYDALSVKEIVARLDGLSGEELGRVRQYESRNKNRTTLLKQIDRKAGGAS